VGVLAVHAQDGGEVARVGVRVPVVGEAVVAEVVLTRCASEEVSLRE
jgi:hypothetical protein